jgi:hypothetical protein
LLMSILGSRSVAPDRVNRVDTKIVVESLSDC